MELLQGWRKAGTEFRPHRRYRRQNLELGTAGYTGVRVEDHAQQRRAGAPCAAYENGRQQCRLLRPSCEAPSGVVRTGRKLGVPAARLGLDGHFLMRRLVVRHQTTASLCIRHILHCKMQVVVCKLQLFTNLSDRQTWHPAALCRRTGLHGRVEIRPAFPGMPSMAGKLHDPGPNCAQLREADAGLAR